MKNLLLALSITITCLLTCPDSYGQEKNMELVAALSDYNYEAYLKQIEEVDDVNTTLTDGYSALGLIVFGSPDKIARRYRKDYYSIVTDLLKRGSNPNIYNEYGNSLIQKVMVQSSSMGDEYLSATLIKFADLDFRCDPCNNANYMHFAAIYCQIEALKYLIEVAPSLIHTPNDNGELPIDWAEECSEARELLKNAEGDE